MRAMSEWQSDDIQEFIEHPEKLAADADLAVKHPEIREAALQYIEMRDFKEE